MHTQTSSANAGSTRSVALAEAQPGDILAEAVAGPDGGVLLAAGATLSESTLASLDRRGVETVTIAVGCEPVQLDPAALEAQRKLIRESVERLFRYSLRQSHVHPLMHLVLRYRTEPSQ